MEMWKCVVVTFNWVYLKNPVFLVSSLTEPLPFIVKDLGLSCFLGREEGGEVTW